MFVNHRSSGHTFRWRLTCSSWPTSNTSQGTVGQPCVVCVCQSSFIWPHLPLEIDILFLLANIKHMTGYCRLPVGGCVLCVCQSSFIWPHLPLEIDMLFQLANIKHQTWYCRLSVGGCVLCVCQSSFIWPHLPQEIDILFHWPTFNT